MGVLDDIGAWFDQAVEDVGEAFDDVGEWVDQAAEDVGEWVDQAIEDTGEWVEQAAEDVAEVAQDVADWTLNVLDDTVFDPIDFLTGGVIDIDYDDGQFSAGLDIGIASVGVSFGEQGFSAESSFDIGLASGEISYDSADGFNMSGSIGAEWLPLPYAEGHMSFGNDGTISIGGSIQGTLPLPFGGEIGGELSGGFERNADGSWGATADLDFDVSSRLTGDISIDASGSVGVDSDGDFYAEGDKDVFIDRDRDGVDDRSITDDDMIDGGLFGGKGGQISADDLALAGGSAAISPAGIATGQQTSQGLESESTRPTEVDDLGLDVTLDFVSPPPVGPNGPPTMDLPPVEEFAPADEFEPIDPLAIPVDEPMAEPAIPEPMPEPPPPSDFAVEIEAIDDVEVAADEMWDDLG